MSKLTRFRTELNALGFDGAIISCKENQYYLSDFNFDDGYVVVTNKKGYVIYSDIKIDKSLDKYLDIDFSAKEKDLSIISHSFLTLLL